MKNKHFAKESYHHHHLLHNGFIAKVLASKKSPVKNAALLSLNYNCLEKS